MIPHFIDLLSKEGFDLVSGNRLGTRVVRKAMPPSNLWANRVFALMTCGCSTASARMT